MSPEQSSIDIKSYSVPAPPASEFNEEALAAAYQAFFDATTGGNFGGVRAAIKAYNEAVASRIAEEA